MSGLSKKTSLITLRLPNDVLCTLERRINGKRGRWPSVRIYLQELVIWYVRRPHEPKLNKEGKER